MRSWLKQGIPGFLMLSIYAVTMPDASAQAVNPELIITQHEYSICSGEEVEAKITIDGTPPVALIYEYNGDIDTVVSNLNDIYLTFSAQGICVITEYKDDSTPLIHVSDSIIINEFPAPEVEFDGGGYVCDTSQAVLLTAIFNGEPPFVLVCRINDIPDTVITNDTTYVFNIPYDFQIVTQEISDLNCAREFIDTAYVRSGDIPAPVIVGDTSVCAGSTAVYSTDTDIFTAEWSVPGIAVYDVDTASNGAFVTVSWTNSGEYTINMKLVDEDSGCESPETELNVSVYSAPALEAEIDTLVCIDLNGDLFIEIPTETGDIVYWPDLDYTGATLTFNEEGTFPFIQTNTYGCSDTSSLNLINNCIPTLHVPEAFTPNGDGINDYLELFGVYHNLDFSVYSPGGLLLFHSMDENMMWDGTSGGKQLPDGSYFWHASYSDNHGGEHKQSGVITIIR
jgi:gliding motility-associated-like protein